VPAPDGAPASGGGAAQVASIDPLPPGLPSGPPDGAAECRRFTACQPENPCHTGTVTGCRRAEPICTDLGGWVSNGTPCGSGAACSMGECTAWTYSGTFDVTSEAPEWTVTGICPLAFEQQRNGDRFLGRFYGDGSLDHTLNRTDATLRLDGLPPHAGVTVAFDLLILGSWDGNMVSEVYGGPDLFELAVEGGQALMSTTFALCDPATETQAFPDEYPASYAPGTGATSVNTLQVDTFSCGFGLDTAVYHLERSFDHEAAALAVRFSGSGLQWYWDESWGLDNVVVTLR
jgi:hypothetical protein